MAVLPKAVYGWTTTCVLPGFSVDCDRGVWTWVAHDMNNLETRNHPTVPSFIHTLPLPFSAVLPAEALNLSSYMSATREIAWDSAGLEPSRCRQC